MKLNDSKVLFNETEHLYTYEGNKLNGITGVISKHLFPAQFEGIPKSVLVNAQIEGTRIHQELFKIDTFGNVQGDLSENYLKCLENESIEVLDNEYLVTNYTTHATAIDKVVLKGGKVGLIDVKTTYKLNKKYLSWQLSICKMFFNIVNPDIDVDFLGCLHVDKKTNSVKFYHIEEIPAHEIEKLFEAERKGELYSDFLTSGDIDTQLSEKVAYIEDLKAQIKSLEQSLKEVEAVVYDEFLKKGVEVWENEDFKLSLKADYTRVSFDSRRFQSENEAIYNQYLKETSIKGGLIVKSK